jgi:hypothetical protein
MEGETLPFLFVKKIGGYIMSNIIDLSILTAEPIVLKFSEEDTFTIPSEPSVEFVLRIVDFEEKLVKAKSNKDQFDFFVKMVTSILQQDEKKEVDQNFVSKKLSLSQMKKVVEIYQSKVLEHQKNPN